MWQIALDRIPCSYGKILRKSGSAESAHFADFIGFAILDGTGDHPTQIRRRNPVLALAWHQMIGNAKKGLNHNFQADFLLLSRAAHIASVSRKFSFTAYKTP